MWGVWECGGSKSGKELDVSMKGEGMTSHLRNRPLCGQGMEEGERPALKRADRGQR